MGLVADLVERAHHRPAPRPWHPERELTRQALDRAVAEAELERTVEKLELELPDPEVRQALERRRDELLQRLEEGSS